MARLLIAVCALLLAACAHRSPDRVEDLLSQAFQAAENHHEFELDPEAAILLRAIQGVDPHFPGVADLQEDLDLDGRLDRSLLGVNRRLRPDVHRELWKQVLLYLPDRVLDLLDVVSFDVHLGWGAFADVYATRAMQFGGGARATGGIGLHDHRSLGLKSQAEAGIHAAIFGADTYSSGLVGTSGARSASSAAAGLHEPTDALYQSFRDYWGVGASATAGIIGAEVEFHPVQLADFVAGWFGLDFLHDDFARTRALRLDKVELQMVSELWQMRDDPGLLEEYALARQQGELSNRPVPQPVEPPKAPSRMQPSEAQKLQPASMISP